MCASCFAFCSCDAFDIDCTHFLLQRKIENTVDAAMLFQPHAVVTVDSKGFSFRFLKKLKCRGIDESISLDLFIMENME